MKEKIDQLENLLRDIKELIEQHVEIVSYKNDHSFYENDIPKLEVLLSDALRQLRAIKNESLESNWIENRNKPNQDIIKLIRQKILNIKSPVSGEMHGKVVSGFLTEDGYLELEINGIKKKFSSLRRAVYEIWRKPLQRSQWEFWKVKVHNGGEEKPLEYFKNLIDK